MAWSRVEGTKHGLGGRAKRDEAYSLATSLSRSNTLGRHRQARRVGRPRPVPGFIVPRRGPRPTSALRLSPRRAAAAAIALMAQSLTS